MARRQVSSILVLFVCVLALAVLAEGAANIVVHERSVNTVHAERLVLPSSFLVAQTKMAQAIKMEAAKGTRDAPVAMKEAPSTPGLGSVPPAYAGTAVAKGDWTYTVFLNESAPGRAALGNYSVSLTLDGHDLGTVYVVKTQLVEPLRSPLDGSILVGVPDEPPPAPVGVRVAFDVGREAPASAFYFLQVNYLDMPTYRLKSVFNATDGSYYWQGVGGSIDGKTNPVLVAPVGTPTRFVIIQGDGQAPHNLAIRDGSDAIVAGPTGDITNLGDQQTLVWTPQVTGAFGYECVFHRMSQRGVLNVTP